MARLPLPGFPEVRRFVLIAGLTALAYALAGWLSLKLAAYIADVVAAVWLAAGIGAMASLRFGAAGVAGTALGSFAINSLALSPDEASSFALGAAAEAWIIGYLPRYLQPFSATLDYVPSVAKFALVAAPLGCALSALTGMLSLYFLGHLPADTVLGGLWVWWLGDLLGVYLIAPLLLTATRWDLLPTNRGARLEGLVLMLGMLALTLAMMEYVEPLRPAEIVLFVMMPAVLCDFPVGAHCAGRGGCLLRRPCRRRDAARCVRVASQHGDDGAGRPVRVGRPDRAPLFRIAARHAGQSRSAHRPAQSLVFPGFPRPCAGARAA
ncbi:MAG: hypothetical protein ABS92_12715 [Thiobacillus sp. SCN 63-374]|nr:MAG: hypothetical protein ABS92_12715 [Thiobacillus sp. SCN 63-374]